MKNSLQMIGIFVILWSGLGIGLANAMTAPATGATLSPSSFPNATQSSPTNTASLQTPGPLNKFTADAGKNSHVSAHQIYAMLLGGVCWVFLRATERMPSNAWHC